MRKSAKLITALSVAGLAVAAGSAFTNSNTFAGNATVPLTGYATTAVSGATVNSLAYNLDESGENVESVTLVLEGNTVGSNVGINFNGDESVDCGLGTFLTDHTTYTCTSAYPTSTLTSTGVVVN